MSIRGRESGQRRVSVWTLCLDAQGADVLHTVPLVHRKHVPVLQCAQQRESVAGRSRIVLGVLGFVSHHRAT
jgi:hypothetical protein